MTKFKIGDIVEFDILAEKNIKGVGEILAKGMTGVCPIWIVLIHRRDNDYTKGLEERAILIQESFMKKVRRIR